MKHIEIYQINASVENARQVLFCGMRAVKRMGLVLSLDMYDKVYDGDVDAGSLDDVYTIFNISHPKDFKGHSLSMSDIVKMDGGYWFCDSFGWTKVEL